MANADKKKLLPVILDEITDVKQTLSVLNDDDNPRFDSKKTVLQNICSSADLECFQIILSEIEKCADDNKENEYSLQQQLKSMNYLKKSRISMKQIMEIHEISENQ